MNDTVNEILDAKHLFWVSIGAVIAVWEISGAMRAVMQVFDRIYDVPETRSFWRRMKISFGLAAFAGVLLLAAAAIVRFGPLAVDAVGGDGIVIDLVSFVARWAIAIALMVSFGALLVVFSWAVTSIVFWWYVTHVADYASIFGSLATIIVAMTYLYTSAIAFLTGVQLDTLVRTGIARRGSA